MTTKFHQFLTGGNQVAGDIVVGLRNGQNYQFNSANGFVTPYSTLFVGQILVPNNGYFLANVIPAIYTLPAVFPFGQIINLINIGGSTITIAQNAGQQIQAGNAVTTLGVGGSIASITKGDSLTIVCSFANTTFYVLDGIQGLWTVT